MSAFTPCCRLEPTRLSKTRMDLQRWISLGAIIIPRLSSFLKSTSDCLLHSRTSSLPCVNEPPPSRRSRTSISSDPRHIRHNACLKSHGSPRTSSQVLFAVSFLVSHCIDSRESLQPGGHPSSGRPEDFEANLPQGAVGQDADVLAREQPTARTMPAMDLSLTDADLGLLE
eukprot:m.59679 g.59679  ORF g.59679 m.59679 type:complete len:171 (+) comp49268_c0_seq5:355-867(+)